MHDGAPEEVAILLLRVETTHRTLGLFYFSRQSVPFADTISIRSTLGRPPPSIKVHQGRIRSYYLSHRALFNAIPGMVALGLIHVRNLYGARFASI